MFNIHQAFLSSNAFLFFFNKFFFNSDIFLTKVLIRLKRKITTEIIIELISRINPVRGIASKQDCVATIFSLCVCQEIATVRTVSHVKQSPIGSQIPDRGTNRINSTSDLTELTREWRSSECRRVVVLNPAGKWKCFAARFTFESPQRTAGSPILFPVNSSLVRPVSTGGLCNDRHVSYIPVTHTISVTFAQVTREELETFFIPCSSPSTEKRWLR